jgi:hypothetical protein
MKHNKIIIWGAKLDTGHTHAFIHEALYRAGQYLNYPTYWLDNRDNVAEDFFDNALVITEQWLVFQNGMSNRMPLNKTATYIVHYLGNKGPVEGNPGADMYLGKVGKLIDFRFANNWGMDGVPDKNYAYIFEQEKYTPINDGISFYEKGENYDNFYSIWATDIMPNEIDFETRFTPFHEPKFAFFGGTISKGWGNQDDGNASYVIPFAEECQKNGVQFIHNDPRQNPLTVPQMREAVLKSYLPVDIRPKNHLANKYVPCRSIKNCSYGQLVITNSPSVYEFFDGEAAYSSDPKELFEIANRMQSDPKTKDLILNQMKKVKDKHTYVSRLNDMITAAGM